MSPVPRFRWTSACRSDVGKLRKVNEDACLDLPERGLWAVADGMGGHDAGDVASHMVVQALQDVPRHGTLGGTVDDVRQRLTRANEQLRLEAMARNRPVVGTTVAVLMAYEQHYVYLWAGDSRVYLYRDRRLRQLSRDHSRVEQLIALGVLRREEAENHPQSNVVTRAVGAADALDLDAEIQETRAGDRFLLCSDGLTKELNDDAIAPLLGMDDPAVCADGLVQAALDRGGRDNVTVVVVHADAEPDPHPGNGRNNP